MTTHQTKHRSEEELIAYQLGESTDYPAVAAHLESCGECAQMAESIAETLRVFSGEAVPAVDMEHAWQRLRGNLPSLAPAVKRHWWQARLAWIAVPVLAAALLLAMNIHVHHPASPNTVAGLPPGPLSAQPNDPEVAAHLENAERLLTEINHADGALDEPTRERAEQLLVSNAVYVQRARHEGDVAEASVLEELGRTLTNVEHAPATPQKGWDVRMEMNTSGLLLDIRVLQQNDSDRISDSDHTKDQQ
jgi:hypothetical protein